MSVADIPSGLVCVVSQRSRQKTRINVQPGLPLTRRQAGAVSRRTNFRAEVSDNNLKKCPSSESSGTYMPAITGELVLGAQR